MPTPELETAEQLVESLCAHVVGRYPDTGIYVDTPSMAALIEADRAVVARRVLEEIAANALELLGPNHPSEADACHAAFHEALCKYAEPSGRTEE